MVAPIIPSPRWYPTNLPARAPWHVNFAAKAVAEGTTYGLTAANVTQIQHDAEMMEYLLDTFVAIDNYEKAWTAFRNGITTDPVGTPDHVIPDPLVLPGDPHATPTGIFQRTMQYRDIVMHSLSYTKEVGESWGIEPTKSSSLLPNEVKPTITVEAAATNYHFSVVASKREKADSFKVFVLRNGAPGWVEAATATGKSIDVHLTPQTPGEPEQLQVRIQLRKSNEDYGQPSDPAYVTINP